jgi:hypothetical protein
MIYFKSIAYLSKYKQNCREQLKEHLSTVKKQFPDWGGDKGK